MAKKLANIILFVAALQVAGGHWLALQSVAWATMLINYSKTDTFSVAVSKTFGGDHPCSLCKVVKKGKSEEEKQGLQSVQKLEAVIAPAIWIAERKGTKTSVSISADFARSEKFPPPTPPPLLS